MAVADADKHSHGNRNYDGSNLVHGVLKKVKESPGEMLGPS